MLVYQLLGDFVYCVQGNDVEADQKVVFVV